MKNFASVGRFPHWASAFAEDNNQETFYPLYEKREGCESMKGTKEKNQQSHKGTVSIQDDTLLETLSFIGKSFLCVRISLYAYQINDDSFHKEYQWIAKKEIQQQHAEKNGYVNTQKKKIHFSKIQDMRYLKHVTEGDSEVLQKSHVFYRYVVEEKEKVVGVILVERLTEFAAEEEEVVSQLLSMLGKEYSAKKELDELHTQNAFLQNLYGKMQTGLIQCVLEGQKLCIISANEASYQIYGCTKEQYTAIYGNSLERFVYVEDWPFVKEQLESLRLGEEIKEYDHRYINYFGQMRWLHVNAFKMVMGNKQEVIQVIIADVTNAKQLETDLEHEKERYRIALDSSSDVIFEYDLMNDSYLTYGSFFDSSVPKTTPVSNNGYKRKLMKGKICEAEFISRYAAFLAGDNTDSFEMLEKYTDKGREKEIWVAVEGTPIYENGILVKMIGKKSNINDRKQKEKEALEVVQRDSLTKLYTRKVGEALVKKYLDEKRPDEIGSLLLIDLDNFQTINDTYGYTFGDAILEEVAEVIKAATRQNDISVRYGGDEFLIFMKNTEPERTQVYGKRIYEKICKLYAGEKENIQISCSVGMVSTEITCDYNKMFQCADSMLVYVKQHGKGDALCYSPSSKAVMEMQGDLYLENSMQVHAEEVVSEKNNEDLVSFAFSILEQTKDIQSAINLLLGKIGRQFKLNKISIIETNLNFLSNIITYEWIAKKEFHDSICKYSISEEELEAWQEKFGADEVFVMEDAWRDEFTDAVKLEENAPRKRNQLYSAVYEEGEFKGALVFEHSDPMFGWPKEVRTKLRELSKIISTHITKANADIASKAKTEFLSRMSHEIRTPMNAIMGMTSIAQSVVSDENKVAECLEKISNSTQYLLSLINDILDMSRIESGNMTVCQEVFQLEKLVSEIVVLMSAQAKNNNITLEVERAYADLWLIGDELRLNQVLINIIGNALKFTPEGGKVIISAKQLMQEDGAASIRFSVKDTGIGINANNLERIFYAFEQEEANTARKFGGTGLGLAISNNLVKLMGGKLNVESQEGKGSEFYFTLQFPISEKQNEHPIPHTEEEEATVSYDGKCILVVEDNDLNAEIAQTVLDMVGVVTERATDGQQAVECFLQQEVGHYDAILMDIRMPVMDGLEATKRIRTSKKEDARTVPIIAMTANAFDEDMKKSIDSGMNGHLSKPIDIKKLYQVLGDILS